MLLAFTVFQAYAMQPPPPPLTIAQLKKLVADAELITVAQVDGISEPSSEVDTTRKFIEIRLRIERNLTKTPCDKYIVIRDNLPDPMEGQPAAMPDSLSGDKKGPFITPMKAGPRIYHGVFNVGDRVILFLYDNQGGCRYRLMGSGSYTDYLGEFAIQENAVQPVSSYRLAEDLLPYTVSVNTFLQLIDSLLGQVQK